MKVLLVTLFLPQEKAYHAGGRYVFELLRQLSLRHEIHLATRLQEDEFPLLTALRPYCKEIHPYPYPAKEKRGTFDKLLLAANYLGFSRFADRLVRRGNFDLVQVEWVESALLIRKRHTPLVLDAHDVISKPAQRAAEQQKGPGGALARLRWLAIRGVERRIMARFRTVLTLSDFDRRYLLAMHPGLDVRSVPIPAGLDIGDRPCSRQPNTILFLASYRYRPVNVRAALWFYRQVFPLVRAEVPDARFIIAGYGPPEELTSLAAADPGVEVPGFVADLEACHKGATLFVAPILTGGGIIVKVLDAMAAGTPVVTTPYGNEGINAVPGRDVMVAEGPAAFAAAVLTLLRDPALAARLGANGRAFVTEQFGLAATVAKIEETWGEVRNSKNRDSGLGTRDS